MHVKLLVQVLAMCDLFVQMHFYLRFMYAVGWYTVGDLACMSITLYFWPMICMVLVYLRFIFGRGTATDYGVP